MRYWGGGIGHKYMQKVEVKHENMFCERSHGKQHLHESGPPQDDDGGDKDATGAHNNGNPQDNDEGNDSNVSEPLYSSAPNVL